MGSFCIRNSYSFINSSKTHIYQSLFVKTFVLFQATSGLWSFISPKNLLPCLKLTTNSFNEFDKTWHKRNVYIRIWKIKQVGTVSGNFIELKCRRLCTFQLKLSTWNDSFIYAVICSGTVQKGTAKINFTIFYVAMFSRQTFSGIQNHNSYTFVIICLN